MRTESIFSQHECWTAENHRPSQSSMPRSVWILAQTVRQTLLNVNYSITNMAVSAQANCAEIRLAREWNGSAVGTETTLHQLSPYIGKIKSTMAASLISQFTD